MNYNIKATGVVLTPEIRSYVERKLHGLDKFFTDQESRVDVELEYIEPEEKKYRTELMLHAAGVSPLRTEAHGSALHESIDIAVGELVRELTQTKKKQQHVVRRSAAKVKDFIRGWREKF